MSKPIEPGCLAMIVPVKDLITPNIGKVVRVVCLDDCLLSFFLDMRFWRCSALTGSVYTQSGPAQEGIFPEESLLRVDDDPDAAEPRITDKELETA